MAKNEISYDSDLLADAQKILGTDSLDDTIRAAMREVLRNSPPFQGFVPVIDGRIVIPQPVLVRHGLDEHGASVELIERKGGIIEMRPRPATS